MWFVLCVMLCDVINQKSILQSGAATNKNQGSDASLSNLWQIWFIGKLYHDCSSQLNIQIQIWFQIIIVTFTPKFIDISAKISGHLFCDGRGHLRHCRIYVPWLPDICTHFRGPFLPKLADIYGMIARPLCRNSEKICLYFATSAADSDVYMFTWGPNFVFK